VNLVDTDIMKRSLIFRIRENTEVFLFVENGGKNLRIFAVD
jgi:hypothetical protein